MKPYKLTSEDYTYLHAGFYGLFGMEFTNKQINKLLKLCPLWDGFVDSMSRDIILESIAKYFIGMDVPKYKNTRHYYNLFYKRVEEKKNEILEYVG